MFHQSSLSIQVYRVAQLKSYKAISRKTYKIEKCFQSKIFMDLWETSLNDLGFTLKVVLQGQAKVGQGKVIKKDVSQSAMKTLLALRIDRRRYFFFGFVFFHKLQAWSCHTNA
uniref:Uncharacterized protein n=1 Tax=Cacopsylla melanoneura TaxID=428564 RepID=A0A8D8XX92_9HEMI